MSKHLRLLGWVVVLAPTACGRIAEDPAATPVVAVDAGARDGGGATGVDAVVSPSRHGDINISTGLSQLSASASFGLPGERCIPERVEGCDVYACLREWQPPQDSAGSITVAVGEGAAPVPMAMPRDASLWYQLIIPGLSWRGGEPVRFRGTGARVPAFDVELALPTIVTVTKPIYATTSATPSVSRAAAIDVAWTANGGDGIGTVLIAASTQSPSRENVECRFPVADGHGVVPASALARLPAGIGNFLATIETRTELVAGDYRIDVVAFALALGSTDGATYVVQWE